MAASREPWRFGKEPMSTRLFKKLFYTQSPNVWKWAGWAGTYCPSYYVFNQ